MELVPSKLEKRILSFWQKNKVFQKSIAQRQRAANFVFYEGPPTANAKAGIHHVLARIFKDIVCRYKTMRGFKVLRKAGWDTHGLPVELEIEKKLGLKSKRDIEQYGIAEFNQKCKESVWRYKKDWEKLTERIGFWLDLKNPYITSSHQYIETVWWILKEIYQKKLLYQAYKVVPYCPRCGTPLSSHEMAQGYKTVKDRSVYVKFQLKSQIPKLKITAQDPKVYLLVWTTTPWTLPGNVALAVGEDIEYVVDQREKETLIIAKKILKKKPALLPRAGRSISKLPPHQYLKGKDLVGLEYEPIFDSLKSQPEKKHYVILGDFVSTEEGTGIVHTAVMYGEDDYELGTKLNLPKKHTVDEEGRFNGLVAKWQGIFVKDAESFIIEDLKKRGLLLREELYEHEYPFCWRCDSPLLYYAKESWFINMQKVKKDLIENNQKINWTPSHLKKGRFGQWLKGVKDWAISRERYWGIPLPFWLCPKCKNIRVIGSLKELEQLSEVKIKDPHRPFIDKITFQCKKCKGLMKRVKEVLDCWFDAGSMPFAQYHYPFQNKALIEKNIQFPADYISEGIDQTRGWFYTLLAISTLLQKGLAYKNIISLGHVLDEKGEKMSKSKGNVVDPWYIIQKYGADTVRWYFYTINQPGDPKLFREKDIEESLRIFIHTFWNSYLFYSTYASKSKKVKAKTKKILDRWIISRLNELILLSTKSFDEYNITATARLIGNFIINDLSLWYIRRSRRRFQRPKSKEDLKEASESLGYVLSTLSKLTAPFIPFLSEEIYQGTKVSVHLEDWPKPNKKFINKKLNHKMEEVRELVALALAQRAKTKIKVRQPLSELQITNYDLRKEKELIELIKEEVNVKKIIFGKSLKLDIKITPELRKEGGKREILRANGDLRKEMKLPPGYIVASIISTAKIVPIYMGEEDFKKEMGAKKFIEVQRKEEMATEVKKMVELEGKKHFIGIKKN